MGKPKTDPHKPPFWWHVAGCGVTHKANDERTHLVLADDHEMPGMLLTLDLNPSETKDSQRWRLMWRVFHSPGNHRTNFDGGTRDLSDGQLEAMFGLVEDPLFAGDNPDQDRPQVQLVRDSFIREGRRVSVPGPSVPGFRQAMSFKATDQLQSVVREMISRKRH